MPKPLILWTPDFYNRLARHYDWLARIFLPLGEKGKRHLASHLKSGKLLDVACGTGSLLNMVDTGHPFGCDTSRGMLNEVRRKLPVADLVQANFFNLPFKDGAFDTVVQTNAVSAVDVGAVRVLSEMLRVCQQGGQVYSADFASPPRITLWHRLAIWFSEFFGDYAHDYVAIFQDLGYQPKVEYLGNDEMYQVVRVRRGAA